MPKCTDCKWFSGWITDIIHENTEYGLCGAFITSAMNTNYDIIDKGSALDDNLECDLYVANVDVDD